METIANWLRLSRGCSSAARLNYGTRKLESASFSGRYDNLWLLDLENPEDSAAAGIAAGVRSASTGKPAAGEASAALESTSTSL